jgi:hypothetical protein
VLKIVCEHLTVKILWVVDKSSAVVLERLFHQIHWTITTRKLININENTNKIFLLVNFTDEISPHYILYIDSRELDRLVTNNKKSLSKNKERS